MLRTWTRFDTAGASPLAIRAGVLRAREVAVRNIAQAANAAKNEARFKRATRLAARIRQAKFAALHKAG